MQALVVKEGKCDKLAQGGCDDMNRDAVPFPFDDATYMVMVKL